MEFMSMFFMLVSVLVLIYLVYSFKINKRMPIFIEFFFIGVYGLIFLVFLYPNILNIIENLFGINSAINFIVYCSIFITYFIIFLLYNKSEKQREDITKLTREIAYLKNDEKQKRKEN